MQVELVVYPWDHEVARGNTPVAVDLFEIGDDSKVLAHVEKVGLVDRQIELPKVLRARDRRLRVVPPQWPHYQDVDLFEGLPDPTYPGTKVVVLPRVPMGPEHLRVVSHPVFEEVLRLHFPSGKREVPTEYDSRVPFHHEDLEIVFRIRHPLLLGHWAHYQDRAGMHSAFVVFI